MLVVVFIYISLIPSEVGHLFMYFVTMLVSSYANCLCTFCFVSVCPFLIDLQNFIIYCAYWSVMGWIIFFPNLLIVFYFLNGWLLRSWCCFNVVEFCIEIFDVVNCPVSTSVDSVSECLVSPYSCQHWALAVLIFVDLVGEKCLIILVCLNYE